MRRLALKWRTVKAALFGSNYDFAFFLELEKAKLEEMLFYFDNYTSIEQKESKSIYREIRLCIYCIDVMLGNIDYLEHFGANGYMFRHKVNDKNIHRFASYKQLEVMKRVPEYMKKEMVHDEKIKHLYGLIHTKVQKWWD